mgnify:FL=1
MIRIVRAGSADEWAEARRLLGQYQASLDFALDFQAFDHELESLEGEYGGPHRLFLIAEREGVAVGCVGLRRFSQGVCEMKRLFTIPAARSQGTGRALAEAVIAAARELGYARMLLDTVPSMAAAQRLYTALGFVPREPYRYNPIPGAVFMELSL